MDDNPTCNNITEGTLTISRSLGSVYGSGEVAGAAGVNVQTLRYYER